MIRKPHLLATVVLVAAAAAIAGATLAHGPRGGPGRRGFGPEGGLLDRLSFRLDLSDEQREQIRTILTERREGDLGQARRASHEAWQELHRSIHDPAADEKAVRQAARRVAQATEDLAVERHAMRVAIFGVLTPEQQQRARELRIEADERREARREGWQRRPDGEW